MRQCKKEQNKTTAQKYRQRKRSEQGLVMTEYEQLEREKTLNYIAGLRR